MRILIFLSGLDGVPLLELPLEKEEELEEEEEEEEVEKGEDELISVCGDVTIGSWWSSYLSSFSSKIGRKSYFSSSSTYQSHAPSSLNSTSLLITIFSSLGL